MTTVASFPSRSPSPLLSPPPLPSRLIKKGGRGPDTNKHPKILCHPSNLCHLPGVWTFVISPSPALCNNTDGDWLSVLSAAVLEVLPRNKFLIILLLTLSLQEPWKPTLSSKCVLKCFCLAWNGQTAHNDKIRPPSWILFAWAKCRNRWSWQ